MKTKKAINLTLRQLGLTGLVGITIAAPSALQALEIFLRKNKVKIPNYQRLYYELKRQGLVHIGQTSDEVSFTLTPAGIHRLQQSIVDELKIPIPKQWDKKWRCVTFDIPNRQSNQRTYFVNHLKSTGFYMFQRSIWVHPFPCFDQVEHLAGHYNVLRYCSLFEISKLDDAASHRLLRRFDYLML